MAEYAIEIENLSFTYRNAQEKALDNISLRVRKGEILGIIGPTGAGKTTLCRCITGIIPEVYGGRLEGKILVQGRDVRQCNVVQLAGMVGYVQQDAESQLLMTDIEKEIVFPLENLGLPREEIGRRLERALKLVRLEPYRYRHPFYLSGGQKQRVVLAAALAMNPEILILDEATSEVDPIGAEEILSVVRDINQEGKTVILIEHNMEELAQYAHRIAVLEKGQKIIEGETKEVLSNVQLLETLDIYPPEVTQLAVELHKRGIPLPSFPIELEEAKDLLSQILGKDRQLV